MGNSAATRQHLAEAHGWTDREFTLFGDTERDQALYIEGAHDQEHEHNQDACNHSHVEVPQ